MRISDWSSDVCSSDLGDYFGFVDDQGIVKFWRQTGSREIAPSDDTLNLFYPLIQTPYWTAEEGTRINVCSSSLTLGYAPIGDESRAGSYPYEERKRVG